MKKTLMMLAIAACAASAQAAASYSTFRITAAYYGGSALATIDNETVNGSGGNQPLYDNVTGFNAITKDGAKELRPGTGYGTLSDGYQVYFIKGKTFSEITAELSDMSYWNFAQTYAKYLADEYSAECIYYGRDNLDHLSVTVSKYADGTSATDLGKSSDANAVAVMTYINGDNSAAQYTVSGFISDSWGGGLFNWFENDPQYGQGVQAWTNFASIPEPTSAMLMLLGVAGLALKRKRA